MALNLTELVTKNQAELVRAIEKYRQKEETWRYLTAALTLFTIIFFTIFALRPTIITISGLVGEIKQKEQLNQKMAQKINAIITAQEEYAQYQEKISLIDSFLPSRLNLAQGLAQLVGATGERGLPIEGINLTQFEFDQEGRIKLETKEEEKGSAKTTTRALKNLEFNFATQGDYQQLKDLILQLEQTRRWLEISQYQLSQKKSKKETQDQSGLLRLSVNGRLYFWSQ